MSRANVYVDLDGNEICLEHLDADERKLLAGIRRRARVNPDWDAFDNYWTNAVPAFYQSRGLARKAVARTVLWRVAEDLSGRLAVASGMARFGDCRDELEELVREKFPSERAFCKATGLSEDMLRHVLAGGKEISLEALGKALERIGYGLRIVPVRQRPAGKRSG